MSDRVLVVDASIVLDLLARFRPQPIEALLWAPGTTLTAPELVDIEVLNALRKLDRDGAIPPQRRTEIPAQMRALRIRKFKHDTLLDGIWSLRGHVTAYDAAYVVLASALKAPLVTRDVRLAKAVGSTLEVLVP
ncbi:MAG: type II toxin-antitoxin system VapC family toxin [Proteobacteria bacterium]|nr:type II toxin-antitoxin system VapC family toxin [Pseudomonadota bacterium]